ncbi:transforming growth factor beta receptor type 3 [Synchiropus picturatus]
MTLMSGFRWTIFCLLLLRRRISALGDGMQCSVAPAGALHPVQALLEQFEAGLGCAARESGDKETRVITVGEMKNTSDNKVVLVLKGSLSPLRSVHLLLSSRSPVRWVLESEGLPSDLPLLVQVSSNSSVESRRLRLEVRPAPWLPTRPRALHRWALKRHGGLSSLTHLARGNRVYVRLGEDPELPAACRLQPTFLSESYVTSHLRPQKVLGCRPGQAQDSAEVHVVKLHSAGSSLCGSLQVEVIVSLLPPLATSPPQQIVLILGSSAPVNWAVTARGLQGHVVVHSSNSVSPPYPPEPDLLLSTTLVPDLANVPDLLLWARNQGYSQVTSYTEAGLANRFLIQLAGAGTGLNAGSVSPDLPTTVSDVFSDELPVLNPRGGAEERRLRELLSAGPGSEDRLAVQCEDGRLSVSVDQVVLQSLSVPVSAVTLQDPTCQAQSNGSHFLLVFPVISCGTEGFLQQQPGAVQYRNMVLLWRDKPKASAKRRPLAIDFTCWTPDPSTLHPGPPDGGDGEESRREGLTPGSAVDPLPEPGKSAPSTTTRHGPLLQLELFVSESYERTHSAPCVVAADHRVYAKISAEGLDSAEVNSCFVSAHPDPKTSPVWDVIRQGCAAEPSLMLVEAEEEEEGGDEDKSLPRKTKAKASLREAGGSLRFSFIVRPIHSQTMQFLHCSVWLCVSDSAQEEDRARAGVRGGCPSGPPIPPLVPPTHKSRCETRNLSRPMVVTRAPGSKPAFGQRTKRLSPLSAPDQEEEHHPVMRTGPVMGIISAAFLLGVGLMVALWCLCAHTGGRPAAPEGGSPGDQP